MNSISLTLNCYLTITKHQGKKSRRRNYTKTRGHGAHRPMKHITGTKQLNISYTLQTFCLVLGVNILNKTLCCFRKFNN